MEPPWWLQRTRPSCPLVRWYRGPGEVGDLLLEEVLDRVEAHGDEGLDGGHLGLEAIDLGVVRQPAQADVFHLAFALDAEYSLHGAAPFSVGLTVVWQQPLHHTGAASSIFN